MSKRALVDPVVRVNNQIVAIIPNSLDYKSGIGESDVKPQSSGNGRVEGIFYENIESKFSHVKFEMRVIEDNIELVSAWKANRNENFIQITEGTLVKTFPNCALTNDPEIKISSDGKIPLEFKGDVAK
jgi:hypothetical protein